MQTPPQAFSPEADLIERATLAAVAPEKVEALAGWLLPLDSGSMGRAKSAVPLSGACLKPRTLERISGQYRRAGLPPAFRLADAPELQEVRDELQRCGYRSDKPTWVQVAPLHSMLALAPRGQAMDDSDTLALADAPDADWSSLFLGPGFDPIDGASRVRSLSRAQGTRYAVLRRNGLPVAAGAASFSHGWVSVHGMRTRQDYRGHGFASRILQRVAQQATAMGLARCFLQVESHNSSAQSLYRRAGFVTAWVYDYWSMP